MIAGRVSVRRRHCVAARGWRVYRRQRMTPAAYRSLDVDGSIFYREDGPKLSLAAPFGRPHARQESWIVLSALLHPLVLANGHLDFVVFHTRDPPEQSSW
jgi:hypothetical protein